MFQFQIHRSDLDAVVSQSTDRWCFGNSFIIPVENPALEAYCVSAGSRRFFYIRERDFGVPQIPGFLHTWQFSDEAYADFKKSALAWPMDFLAVELDPSKKSLIQIFAGPYQHVPLFLYASPDTVYGDWVPTRLYPFLKSAAVEPLIATSLLYTSQHAYSKLTLFKDLYRLTQRTTACFTAGSGLNLTYPEPSLHVLPRTVKAEADVVQDFISVCQQLLKQYIPPDPNLQIGVQLSGGTDSTTVISMLNAMGVCNMQAYTYCFPEDEAESDQDRDRLREITNRFGLQHQLCRMQTDKIFENKIKRLQTNQGIWYIEHPYYQAHVDIAALYKAHHTPIVLGGVGGDEVTSLSQAELLEVPAEKKEQHSISHHVAYQPHQFPYYTPRVGQLMQDCAFETLLSPDISAFPDFDVCHLSLEQGIWEQHPFTRLEMREFIRSLPVPWRRRKRIFRETLRHLGFSKDFAYPLRQHRGSNPTETAFFKEKPALVWELFSTSRLAEQGIIDIDGLLKDYQRFIDGQGSCIGDWAPRYYYQLVTLELAIRSAENLMGKPH